MTERKKILLFSLGCSLLAAWPAQAAPRLMVGQASGKPGATLELPVSFDPGGASVSGVQFTLILPASLESATVKDGAASHDAGKSVVATPSGKSWNFVVFGVNQKAIKSGVLLTAMVKISPSAKAGSMPVSVTKVQYAN